MNELHKAFTALGLEPGAPFETVKRRYRRFALVWHPDRMTNAEAKREAEEELKKINNSFDKLKKHFETEHKSGPSCRCQPAAAGPPPNYNSHQGPDPRRQQEEAERKRNAERARQAAEAEAARKRNEERQRQAAAEEAAQRAAEAARRAQEKQRVADEAIKAEALRKEEVTRWKCTAAVALTFIGLVLYCWIGCAVRDAAHALGQQWDNFQSQFKPKDQSPQPITEQPPPAQQNQPYVAPYVPPYERLPDSTPPSWRQLPTELPQLPTTKPDYEPQPGIDSPAPQPDPGAPTSTWRYKGFIGNNPTSWTNETPQYPTVEPENQPQSNIYFPTQEQTTGTPGDDWTSGTPLPPPSES